MLHYKVQLLFFIFSYTKWEGNDSDFYANLLLFLAQSDLRQVETFG